MSTGTQSPGSSVLSPPAVAVVVIATGARRTDERERDECDRQGPQAVCVASADDSAPDVSQRVQRTRRRQAVGIPECGSAGRRLRRRRGSPDPRARRATDPRAPTRRDRPRPARARCRRLPRAQGRGPRRRRVPAGAAAASSGRAFASVVATTSYAVPRVCSHVSKGSRPGAKASSGIARSSRWNHPGNASFACQSAGVTRSGGISSVATKCPTACPTARRPTAEFSASACAGRTVSPGFVPTEVGPRRSRVFTQTGPRHLAAARAGEHVGAVLARDEHDRRAGDRADVGIEQRFVARLGPPIAHDLRPRRDRDPGVDIRGLGRVDQIGGVTPAASTVTSASSSAHTSASSSMHATA